MRVYSVWAFAEAEITSNVKKIAPAKAQSRKGRRKDSFDEFLRFSLRLCAFGGDFIKEVLYNLRQFTSMLTKAMQNHGASLKRGLGLLLVLFIVYGTTVEAAHRHGVATPQSNGAVLVTNPNSGSSSTANARPGCSDCLLCQLHQNLSATLISIKLNAAPVVRVTYAQKFDPVVIRSIAYSPQSGRAPPQAN